MHHRKSNIVLPTHCYSPLAVRWTSTAAIKNDETLKLKQQQQQLDPYDEHMIQLLMEYQNEHGDCHVPTGNSVKAQQEREGLGVSTELATWVVKQRNLYKRTVGSKKSIGAKLSTKILLLESLGFMWSSREAQWQRNFNRLEKYRNENNGNLQVSKQDNLQLWNWMDQQRKAYRQGKLSEERENLLLEIDFVFDVHEAAWWNYYDRLVQYKNEHGDAFVPVTHGDLGSWVARQRSSSKLDAHRVKALDQIGFSWKAQRDVWEKNYQELVAFYKQQGHTRVPKSAGPLFNWVDRQRRLVKEMSRSKQQNTFESDEANESLLNDENLAKLVTLGLDTNADTPDKSRTKRLMDLTFEVAVHEEKWKQSFRELRAFHKKYGHFSVHGKYKELSAWVRHQRYLYHKDELSENRVSLLDGIGFEWTAEEARWNRMYEELLLFHQENGHVRIPAKNAALYRWTKQQKEKLLTSATPLKSSNADTQQRFIVLQEILLE